MSTGREERLPGRRAGQVSAISLESLYAALGFQGMIPSALQRSRGRCDVIVAGASKGAGGSPLSRWQSWCWSVWA